MRRPKPMFALAALALAGACKPSADAPAALSGTYAIELQPDSAGAPAERWVLTLADGGRFTVTRGGQPGVEGRYRIAADTIVFSEEAGPLSCPDAETGPGTYTWRLGARDLTLTPVTDRCDGRRATFAVRPLTRS